MGLSFNRSGAFGAILLVFAASGASSQTCQSVTASLNAQYVTHNTLQAGGALPVDSGVIVHTIHGPGQPPTQPGYLDFTALEAIKVTPAHSKRSCGDWLSAGVFLPWCGSNHDPKTKAFNDASSWTYVRSDTLNHGTMPGMEDEVVCSNDFDKRYGLVFSNAYMNLQDNLGCMYPLDGDTGSREDKGCGKSTHPWAAVQGEATCPVPDSPKHYDAVFDGLVATQGSRAGSLVCSLAKGQFDTWIDVRKTVDLSATIWPLNEFVLWNWETYSTQDIADNGFLVGIYYLTDCARTPIDGQKAVAQRIAALFKSWTGVDVPVFALSNGDIRTGSKTPFTCH